jgi:hypothetical protein
MCVKNWAAEQGSGPNLERQLLTQSGLLKLPKLDQACTAISSGYLVTAQF